MPTVGTKPPCINSYVLQGSTFEKSFTIKDSAGTLVNLTESSFAGQVRKTRLSTTVAATFTITIDLGLSKVTYSLSAAVTAAMTAGETDESEDSQYVYDIEWTKPDGSIQRIFGGVLTLSPEVTR